MVLKKVIIHNFRSILDASFELEKYSLLIGENNSGKTNIISALRVFYEDNLKYDIKRDFPKCKTLDKESWIELCFETTVDEQNNLKDEYKSVDNFLKVRRYFRSEKNPDLVKNAQSNIYAYESNNLSTNLFYGAKNISQAKLGKILYIPELSKTDDNFKMSGPSPLRDMIDFVMQKVVKNSQIFSNLQVAFDTFNKDFKEESSKDGFSLNELTKDINENIKEWGINFGLNINNITADNIMKNLVSHYIEDQQLNGEQIPLNCFGQGLQRHLIYTLIKVGAKYVDKKTENKKEFSPDLTIVLFEEPEAFLHPSQQEFLNINLHKMSEDPNQQVICTTHSSIFVCKNVESLPSLIKLKRENGCSDVFQINEIELSQLFDDNNSMFNMFSRSLTDVNISSDIKSQIQSRNLGSIDYDLDKRLEEESLKYSLWLDSERSCAFFAKHVIICEGASEKVFLDYLINTNWNSLQSKHLYILDAMGKYNLHRYMNLFGELGIYHSVLYDSDSNAGIHLLINSFIFSKKNNYTKGIYSFTSDIEDFLSIQKPLNRNDLKPLNIMWNYKNNNIDTQKIFDLKEIIESII